MRAEREKNKEEEEEEEEEKRYPVWFDDHKHVEGTFGNEGSGQACQGHTENGKKFEYYPNYNSKFPRV